MDECIFCKIATKKLGTDLLYEDNDIVAFNDIEPKAPQHVLIIPRKHIATLNDITQDSTTLVGKLLSVAATLAKKLQIDQTGYRTVINCNKDGGQAVFHIHLHLLGGRPMTWPPG